MIPSHPARLLVVGLGVLATLLSPAAAQRPGHLVQQVRIQGRLVDVLSFPGRPPVGYRAPVYRSKVTAQGEIADYQLANVPAITWSFGCSPTAAAMMMAYYDRNRFPNMYAGSTNGGVYPLTPAPWGTLTVGNETWEGCPLATSARGLDGREKRGHVNNYYVKYESEARDPFVTHLWPEHRPTCLGDFMGTSQKIWRNHDGSTNFMYEPSGWPLYDPPDGPGVRDGCHGMKEFAQWRGYTVDTVFNQYVDTYENNGHSFTWDDYRAEIDAGRPVLIHVWGHTMLGLGYARSGSLGTPSDRIILYDTWDRDTHALDWHGSYAGMEFVGVTVFRLQGGNRPPRAPSGVRITPRTPRSNQDITALALDGSDPDGDRVSWEYAWVLYRDGGPWQGPFSFGNGGPVLPASDTLKGDRWRALARTTDGRTCSAWVASDEVTIGNTPPPVSRVTISPSEPRSNQRLEGWVSYGDDDDGDVLFYSYRWYYSVDDGASWRNCPIHELTVPASWTHRGDLWKLEIPLGDGTDTTTASSPVVTILNTPPTAPTTVSIAPAGTGSGDLLATAEGITDDDGDSAQSYNFQWYSSVNGGAFQPGPRGPRLPGRYLQRGQWWAIKAAAYDGYDLGAWSDYSLPYQVDNSPPTAPNTPVVTPATPGTTDVLSATTSGGTDPEHSPLSYRYQWAMKLPGADQFFLMHEGSTVPASMTELGQQWRVHAFAFDGQVIGPASPWSPPVTIVNKVPTRPALVAISPERPLGSEELRAAAAGSTDADGDPLTYEFQWVHRASGALLWPGWGKDPGSASVPASATQPGEQWKCRGRCTDPQGGRSPWLESAPVTIRNTPPPVPTTVAVNPISPRSHVPLTAQAAGDGDADGDAVTYEFQWASSANSGATWTAWALDGAQLPAWRVAHGDWWKARGRAYDGTARSAWRESAPVIVRNALPSRPLTLAISPASPVTSDNLVGTASGSTDADGDALTYEYQWAVSADGNGYGPFGYTGPSLDNALTSRGEFWTLRARAHDGQEYGPWEQQLLVFVRIGNAAPAAPHTLTVTPADPSALDDLHASASADEADGDPLTYEFQWAKSTDAGQTWSDWILSGPSLDHAYLAPGDWWKPQARASDGSDYGPWAGGPPVVIGGMLTSQVPAVGATGVNRMAPVVLTFRWPMNQADVEGRLHVTAGGAPVPGVVDWPLANEQLRFTPRPPLTASNTYTVRLDENARRLDGTAVPWDESFSFTTGNHPVVTSWAPQGTTVALNASGSVQFDRGMNWTSVQANCTSDPWIVGHYAFSTNTMYFTPSTPLATGTTYRITIRAGALDMAGVSLGRDFSWEFTTAASGSTLGLTAAAASTRGGMAQIAVHLTSTAQVRVTVLNLAGRTVAILPETNAAAGTTTLLWDGRSTAGTRVPGGRYLVRVEALPAEGQRAICLTPLSR